MKYIGIACIAIAAFVIFILTILALDYGGVMWQSVIAPERENVRRDVWEQTRSFNEGKRQELVRYMHEYNTAKDEQTKSAVKSAVRLSFADINEQELEPELRNFLTKCRGL